MNWLKNIIVVVTAGLPLIFIGFDNYVRVINPGGYTVGIGVVYLLFLIAQIGMSVVSAVAYEAIAVALCSLFVMVCIGFYI